MVRIVCVVVLYRTTFAESASLRTLRAALEQRPELGERLDLVVFDNSLAAQPVPGWFDDRYVHDGSNVGLARRYNAGLLVAEEVGAAWLLLLDQDTSLTAEYLDEVFRTADEVGPKVVGLVPRLMEGGRVQSPHRPFYLKKDPKLDLAADGVAGGLVRAYNSGAVLRVGAVEGIGGFPEAYGLDYLDHAVFHRLQAAGGQVYLLRARLGHEMSIHVAERFEDPAHAARHRGQLAAERRFYREHGGWGERVRHRLDYLKQALRPMRYGHWAEAGRMLGSVVRWD